MSAPCSSAITRSDGSLPAAVSASSISLQRLGAAALHGERFHDLRLQRDAAFEIDIGLREQVAADLFDERPAIRLLGDGEEIEQRIDALRVPLSPSRWS